MANLIRGEQYRWPWGMIPYTIDSDAFPEGTGRRAKIQAAIDHWNSRSRLKWVPDIPALWWVRFAEGDAPCRAEVGRQFFPGSQHIACPARETQAFSVHTILHEMGHSAGLFHEHQRPDRDDYVVVTDGDDNYDRKDPDEVILLTPYDYLSIMHYGRGENLDAPPQYVIDTIGSRLSYLDLLAIEQAHGLGRGDYWQPAVDHQMM
jgi:Astacin (Peptidase family M12A)